VAEALRRGDRSLHESVAAPCEAVSRSMSPLAERSRPSGRSRESDCSLDLVPRDRVVVSACRLDVVSVLRLVGSVDETIECIGFEDDRHPLGTSRDGDRFPGTAGLLDDVDLGSEFVGLDVELLLIELVEQRLRIGGVASRGGTSPPTWSGCVWLASTAVATTTPGGSRG